MIQGQQAQTNCSSKAVGTGSKGKYPCDNCDSTEKWKSSFNCPNYHIHIHQLAAKVERSERKQAERLAPHWFYLLKKACRHNLTQLQIF
jgi:hypothetical protein